MNLVSRDAINQKLKVPLEGHGVLSVLHYPDAFGELGSYDPRKPVLQLAGPESNVIPVIVRPIHVCGLRTGNELNAFVFSRFCLNREGEQGNEQDNNEFGVHSLNRHKTVLTVQEK